MLPGSSSTLANGGDNPFSFASSLRWCKYEWSLKSGVSSKWTGTLARLIGVSIFIWACRCRIFTLCCAVPLNVSTSARPTLMPVLPKCASNSWNFSNQLSGHRDWYWQSFILALGPGSKRRYTSKLDGSCKNSTLVHCSSTAFSVLLEQTGFPARSTVSFHFPSHNWRLFLAVIGGRRHLRK